MYDIMIDIETMSTSPTAAVLSVGAQIFRLETGERGDTFYGKVALHEALRYGVKDDSTMSFWNSPKAAPLARQEAFGGTRSALEVATDFATFVGKAGGQAKPWGNGSIFDVTILEHWFNQVGVPVPWKFWNVQDLRTLTRLAGTNGKSVPFIGTPHIAIDDAMHEVSVAIFAYNKIFSTGETEDPEISMSVR